MGYKLVGLGWLFIFGSFCGFLAETVGPFSKLWLPEARKDGFRYVVWFSFLAGVALIIVGALLDR